MPQPRSEKIAAVLRGRIDSGQEGYRPGDRLPGIHRLASEERAGMASIREALAILELEGRVIVQDKRGTFVKRPDAPRHRIDVGSTVDRNGLGYVFTRSAGHWPPVGVPSRAWVPADADIAEYLGVDEGTEVLARYRVVGPNGQPIQITTTYIAPDLARGTILERADTLPGGILDRIEQSYLEEDLGLGELTWCEDITTRLPAQVEADTLGMSPSRPVLVRYRPGTTRDDRTVVVDRVVVEGERFKLRVPITRSENAKWPTAPATARNSPARLGDTPREVETDPAADRQGG